MHSLWEYSFSDSPKNMLGYYEQVFAYYKDWKWIQNQEHIWAHWLTWGYQHKLESNKLNKSNLMISLWQVAFSTQYILKKICTVI